jgi:hypothetical protein
MAEDRYNVTAFGGTSGETDQASRPNDDSFFTVMYFSPSPPPFLSPRIPSEGAEVRQKASLVSEDVNIAKPPVSPQSFRRSFIPWKANGLRLSRRRPTSVQQQLLLVITKMPET